MAETVVNIDNTSSHFSPIGTITFASMAGTDAEVDYPPFSLFPLRGSVAPNCFLVDTVWLDVRRSEDGKVIVSSSRFDFYGVGETLEEALEDATEMLLALYEDLSEDEESLPSYYRERLERLRTILITS